MYIRINIDRLDIYFIFVENIMEKSILKTEEDTSNNPNKKEILKALSWLVKDITSLDEKIKQYTPFKNTQEFIKHLNDKKVMPNIELLLQTKCNLDCKLCFFQWENDYIDIINQEMGQISEMILNRDPKSLFYIYPREISLAKNVIPILNEIWQNFVLTNWVYSQRAANILFKQLKENGINEISFSYQSNSNIFSDLYNADQAWCDLVKQNIIIAKKMWFKVNLYSEVYKDNYSDIFKTCKEAELLGADNISFLRVWKVGNAIKIPNEEFKIKYTLSQKEMEEIVLQVSRAKKELKIRIIMTAWFGINFYSSWVFNYYLGKSKNNAFNMNIRNHCPAIDNLYYGVSLPSGNIYPCFTLQSLPETQIWKIDKWKITINKQRIDKNELINCLDWICSSENCEYYSLCFWWCRSAAYTNAKMNGHPNPKYAGMDLCITNTIKNMIK